MDSVVGSAVGTTLVVPCYNEEKRLDTDSFWSFLSTHPQLKYHFVNDGSRDSTLAVLQAFQARDPSRIEVLDLPANVGKAEAVRQGLIGAASNGSTIVGYWDADLSTPLTELPRLMAAFETGQDVRAVLGSRVRLLGLNVKRKPTRHYAGRAFATAASLVLGLPVYDTQCGAKLFWVSPELHDVLAEPFQTNWIFDVELLARLVRALGGKHMSTEGRLVEVPLSVWHDVPGSKIRLRDGLRAGLDLLRIRRLYPPTSGHAVSDASAAS